MLNLIAIIKAIGYLGIFGVVFTESGILLGLFLPGDSLLFTAGLLCSSGFLNIMILIPVVFIAAVLGDNFGYYLGHKFGCKIFNNDHSLFFNPRHIVRTENFFKKYGIRTIFFARFIPIVRTLAPVMSGIGNMDYKQFFLYNIMGGLVWSVLIPLTGYYLGNSIPDIDRYILPIAFAIIIISTIPIIMKLRK